ncbi:uncharacterized protein LOC119445731 [Dermacentor silvarum]|uniref:uncharacterized protein LOC119445731 n=1 Tax=Dermacentor silvarum TaxID=543639 RepID=UPI002100F40F|nr:uncharacterized protein LOC119445731 [Dermacentor silvarum]
MASASFHTCCLIWSVLCCSQVYALEAGKVAFVRHACQYGYNLIQAQYTLKDECKRATCYISDRRLTIEECAATAPDNSSCSVKSDFKKEPFPFCCESRICRGTRTIINGIITHYGTKGAADHARYLEPTERWSAPMKYILGACKNGQCRYRKQRVVHETKLTTPCVSARTYEGKDYIGVEECPTFPEGDRNCVKLNDGNPNNRYPYCCPEYMCPAKGRERRNTTHVEKAVMHKGMCKYGGNAFAHDFSTLEPCRTAVCDVQRRWVTVITCLDDEDLNWTRCKAVNPVIRRYGNHPVCCPDYMCPDMKVDRLPEPQTFKTEYKIDVCIFRGRYFRKNLSTSDSCELWTCDVKKAKVKVYTCEKYERAIEPGCTLEVKNPQKPYPDCCKRKVCRYYFSTHYPGSYIAPSPL